MDNKERLKKWRNTFYKTITNPNLIYNEGKDITKLFIDMLADTDFALYDYLVVAYSYEELDQSLVFKLELEKWLAKSNNKTNQFEEEDEVYVEDVKNYSILRLKMIKCPDAIKEVYRGHALENTKNEIKAGLLKRYQHVIPRSLEYIMNSEIKKTPNVALSENTDRSLFLEDVFILVPNLVDNSYYDIGGTIRYPLYTDAFQRTLTNHGEIGFVTRNKSMKKGSKSSNSVSEHYFAICKLSPDSDKDVLSLSYYKNLFNPLGFFPMEQVDKVMVTLRNIFKHDKHMLSVLDNTYEDRLECESNYRKTKEMIVRTYAKNDSMKPSSIEKPGAKKMIFDTPITTNKLIDFCVGLSANKFMVVPFGDITDIFIRYGLLYKSPKPCNPVDIRNIIRGELLIETIISNTMLTLTSNAHNPLDIDKVLAYRKRISGKEEASADKARTLKIKDRYINKRDIRYLDPISTKSDSTIGISGMIQCSLEDKNVAFNREEYIRNLGGYDEE
ncbi:MAG: hypothetical protein ACRCX2_38920 [Paraclostridium sp.]